MRQDQTLEVIHKRFSRVKVDKGKLTRSPVGVCVVVISRFANIAVPISSSAMRADADALLQRQLGGSSEADSMGASTKYKLP